MPPDKWLVELDCVLVLVVLHEENMSDIEFPSLVLRAKLCGLSEDLLNLVVVSFVPVHFSLHHQHRDVLVESRVVLLKGLGDDFGVSFDSCVLDALGLFPKHVDMLSCELFELGVGFFLR